jgi:SnoaL-like domain
MLQKDKDRITDEVRPWLEKLILYSETAQWESFLSCYAQTPEFLAVSADGIIRNFGDFRTLCKEYYQSVKEQKATTIRESFHILDERTVILSWSGDIDAFFKTGEIMKMRNYTVTFLYQKIEEGWKVVHSHESTLPPQIVSST